MPLIKRNSQPTQEAPILNVPPLPPGPPIEAVIPLGVAITAPLAPKVAEPKASRTKPLDKDGYWERKEARDIRTGECIRLSGILQALLGSVNYGQYCTTADKATYLAELKKDAKELAKFITDEA